MSSSGSLHCLPTHKLELISNIKLFKESNITSVHLNGNTDFNITACCGEYPGSSIPEDVCWRGHPPQFGNHQFRPSHWLLTGRWPESDCVSGILTNLLMYTYLTLSTCMYYQYIHYTCIIRRLYTIQFNVEFISVLEILNYKKWCQINQKSAVPV